MENFDIAFLSMASEAPAQLSSLRPISTPHLRGSLPFPYKTAIAPRPALAAPASPGLLTPGILLEDEVGKASIGNVLCCLKSRNGLSSGKTQTSSSYKELYASGQARVFRTTVPPKL